MTAQRQRPGSAQTAKAATLIVVAGLVLALAGCSGSATSSSVAGTAPVTPDTPTPEVSSSSPSSSPTPTPATPVAVGQTVFKPDTGARLVGDGQMFATAVNSGQTIKTYNIDGSVAATISTPEPICEIGVFGNPAGREIVYDIEYTNQAAQGISVATEKVEMVAYDAHAGSQLWRSVVLPTTPGTADCTAARYPVVGAGGLFSSRPSVSITATQNKQYVLASLDGNVSNGGVAIENTTTGKVTTVNVNHSANGGGSRAVLVANYVARTDIGPNGFDVTYLIDPAAGAASKPLATSELSGSSLPVIPKCGSDSYDYCAASGGGIAQTSGAVDGNLSVASLPSVKDRFSVAPPADYEFGAYADDPTVKVVIAALSNGPDTYLVGFSDTAGTRLWKTASTGSNPTICGVANGQAIVAVNNQLATIDLRDGSQGSYSPGSSDCPVMFGNGYAVDPQTGAVIRVL